MNWNDFVAEHGKPWITNRIDLDGAYIVITFGRSAVGWVRYEVGWDDPVIGLVVHPISRGMGFGRAMMESLEASIIGRGFSDRIRIHVNPKNDKALRMYINRGYEKIGERENKEWIMRKFI